MSKFILLAIIGIALIIGFFVYYKSSSQMSSLNPPNLPLKGMERAQYLISTASTVGTIQKADPIYDLSSEGATSVQGYSINSTVYFSLYEMKDLSNIQTICENFKREIALENIQTYCSTNGNVLLLGYAPQQEKTILNKIVQAFAGEE